MTLIIEWLGWLVLAVGLAPVLYLTLTGLAALIPKRTPSKADAPPKRIVIVIPAHNESLLISQTVSGALQQHYPADHYQVYVIADNCSDDTAEKARAAGARVLERKGNPGKGQGLNEAFTTLLKEDWEAFLVVDADTNLHPDVLQTLSGALSAGVRAAQVRYGVLNPAESIRTKAMEVALASFNALRPKGRSNLGISAGLFGNGFCLSREVLETTPYLAQSIVEDLEYHLRLLEAGYNVLFIDEVWVKAQMPATAQDATSQRVRWERGRMAMIRTYAPKLTKKALSGSVPALEALIDVIFPPASIIGLLLIAGGGLGYLAGALAVGPIAALFTTPALVVALSGFALLFLHYVIASAKYGNLGRMVAVLGYLPWYVFWKTVAVAGSMFNQKNLPWVRTKRH